MLDMRSNILISIVSWRYLNHVSKVINAIESSMKNDDYLVVIETGGQKNTDVERYMSQYNNMQIIYCDSNDGYAASHKIAADKMLSNGYDGILIINPDLKPDNISIDKLKECIIATHNTSVIGTPVFNVINDKLSIEYLGYPVPNNVRETISDCLSSEKDIPQLVYDAIDLHGCFMYIPADIIRNYGWMDTKYFLYGEENEYLYRLHKRGVTIKVYTDLYVVHENGGSFINDGLKNIREYYRTRNRLYNNYIMNGMKGLCGFNLKFFFKYFIGRYIMRKPNFMKEDTTYYNFIGHVHFLIGKRGKTFDPNDYVQ